MYSLTHIDPTRPPTPTRFLNLRVLCGQCNYKCCNSPSLVVECTPQESEELKLPIVFPQEGHCRCLTPTGCAHGPRRPVFCKLFPLQVTKDNKLIVSHWAILNCPMAHDYRLVGNSTPTFAGGMRGVDDGWFCYERNPAASGAKRNNSPKEISRVGMVNSLKYWPTALEMGREALVEIYGMAGYQQIADGLARMNKNARGFGIDVPKR